MYLLNTGNLLPGDIVLTAQDAKVSRKIRKHTKSDFSHALLYVSHSSYIHSDLNGVHSGNTQRLLFHDLAHAIVLRVSSPEHRNRIAMACEFARSQVGKQYSVVEAAKSLGNRKISAQTKANRQFCSRLVAQSFAYANIPLVVNPDYCYPEDLHNPEYVAPIESPLRLATSFEIEFANSPSPLDLQRNITNDIIAMARKLSGEDIQTEEEIVDAILRQQQIDKPLTEFVRNSWYFDLWKIDVENTRWRDDVLHFRA